MRSPRAVVGAFAFCWSLLLVAGDGGGRSPARGGQCLYFGAALRGCAGARFRFDLDFDIFQHFNGASCDRLVQFMIGAVAAYACTLRPSSDTITSKGNLNDCPLY